MSGCRGKEDVPGNHSGKKDALPSNERVKLTKQGSLNNVIESSDLMSFYRSVRTSMLTESDPFTLMP